MSIVNFTGAKVAGFEDATLAGVVGLVNAFFQSQNASSWRLVKTELFYAAGAGDPYIILVTYTGN